MKRLLLLTLLTILALPLFAAGDSFTLPERFDFTDSCTGSFATGASELERARPYFAVMNDRFYILGGTRFVDGKKSVRQDGVAMKFVPGNGHTTIQVLPVTALPEPSAEGLTLPYKNGLLLIGGIDAQLKPHNRVYFLTAQGEECLYQPMPALPEACAMTCGGVIEDKSQVPSVPIPYVYAGNKLFAFDNGQWLTLPGIPSDVDSKQLRSQACAAVRTGNMDKTALFIFGGYDAADPAKHALFDAWEMVPARGDDGVLRVAYRAIEPLSAAGHDKAARHMVCTIGAQALPAGAQSLFIVGGFDGTVWNTANATLAAAEEPAKSAYLKEYLAQDAAAFKWNKNIFEYHTVIETSAVFTNKETNTASGIGTAYELPYATCGAAVGMLNGHLIIAGGEIKPAVRTDQCIIVNMTQERTFGTLNWIVFLVYLGLMLPFGYIFMKRNKNTGDYFKGGGKIPWWVTGVAIFAAMLSSITFMTIPAMTYSNDWRFFPLALSIFALAPIVIYFYLPFYRRLNITSAYEYLEKRFNTFSRVFASAAFVSFMVVRSAIVVYLPSLALSVVVGLDIFLSIALVGAVTVLYSTIGGVTAVIWSEFIQAVVLVGGAILAVVTLIAGTPDGIVGTFQTAMEADKLRLLDLDWSWAAPVLWVTLIGGIAQNLSSYTSDQTIVQKYMTTKDEKSAARSIWFNGILSVISSVIFYFIGTCLYAYYKNNPQHFDWGLYQNDAIFPTYIVSQMPPGLSGLLIAAIFAAAMSTLSANFNSAATAFVSDFYQRFLKRDEAAAFKMAKTSTMIIGILAIGFALLIATIEIKSLFMEFQKVIGILTGGLAGLFVMGIFLPRINGIGAVCGLTASYAVNIVLIYTQFIPHKPHFLLYGAVGLIACIVVGYAVSLLTGKPHQTQLDNLTLKYLKKEQSEQTQKQN